MKRIFNIFPKGAILAGLLAAAVEGSLILSVEKTMRPWILVQSCLFWFSCGVVVYQLNPKREFKMAIIYTLLLNLPWFIALSLGNGKTEHFVPLLLASILMGIGIAYFTKWISPPSALTVEWAPFEILENVSEAKLIETSRYLQSQFLNRQKGFVKRELLHLEDKKWVDIVYWESKEFAKLAMDQAMKSEICLHYFQLMKPMDSENGSGILHLTKKYEYGTV